MGEKAQLDGPVAVRLGEVRDGDAEQAHPAGEIHRREEVDGDLGDLRRRGDRAVERTRAVDRLEIGEAHLHGDRPGGDTAGPAPRRHGDGELTGLALERGQVVIVEIEGLFTADRADDALSHDPPVVPSGGEVGERPAVRLTEHRDEPFSADEPEVPDSRHADAPQALRGGRSDARDRADRMRPQEGGFVGHCDEDHPGSRFEPVRPHPWLGGLRGELGDELRPPDSDRAGEAELLEDPLAQVRRDRPAVAEQLVGARHVEERLVDGDRLDDGRHRAADPDQALARRLVLGVVPGDDDEPRTAPARLGHRHRRDDPEDPRLV